MTFKEYEEKAASTACYAKSVAIPYVVMGLTNELGEVFEKIDSTNYAPAEIYKEIGDVLWYVAMTKRELQLAEIKWPAGETDLDQITFTPSLFMVYLGCINGQVKKFFRDDWKEGQEISFTEGRKATCHEALVYLLKGLQDLASWLNLAEGEKGITLEMLAFDNTVKLAKRKEENKIHGDGDNR